MPDVYSFVLGFIDCRCESHLADCVVFHVLCMLNWRIQAMESSSSLCGEIYSISNASFLYTFCELDKT